MVSEEARPGAERVRAAELVAALSLATDLGSELPLEHGLESTLFAMRLCERLGTDAETSSQAYYACLLFHIGCTVDAEIVAEVFEPGALNRYLAPAMFGSRAEKTAAMMRALPATGRFLPVRALQRASRLPMTVKGYRDHLVAVCEVGQMLTDRLGLPPAVQLMFAAITERWDGKGMPGRAEGEAIPLAVRIVHVARDTAFHRMLGGDEFAARVVHERGGRAFDPAIARRLAAEAPAILALDAGTSGWDAVLACEPAPRLTLEGEAIDRALAAMGDFADLASPYLAGHAAGVAGLASAAATRCRLAGTEPRAIRRAAHVHDLGRIAVPVAVWQKPGPLSAGEWEQVRLHAYHSERILCRSPFLAALAPTATAHHERLDGSGYHRGAVGAALSAPARLLAAADAYHAMTEPRAHRTALPPARAAAVLGEEASMGRLDAEAVAAVIEAAGQQVPRIDLPAGLTDREAEVVGLLARGLQTKQVARALGISVKTADRHVQNAYRKIGVSTRAAATLFAMENGLVAWGELPIARARRRA